MGMFDDVKCEYPLPDEWAQDLGFQTKDLHCLMDQYTITKEGRLIQHIWEYEGTPKAELPYPDALAGSLQSIMGITRRIDSSERLIDTNYHGLLRMIAAHYPSGKMPPAFVEYTVKFTDGTVASIDRGR